MQSLYEILKASKTGIAPDMYTALYSKAIAGGTSVAEYTGPVPVTITANGEPLVCSISGNMEQTGTPTPENPIQPQETGDKTENLFDASTAEYIYNSAYNEDGEIVSTQSSDRLMCWIKIQPETSYTFSSSTEKIYNRVYFFDTNKQWIGRSDATAPSATKRTFTTPVNCAYVNFQGSSSNRMTLSTIMLNYGETALPYQPYGYKIPISSGGTTTPIYLGEVQSTRMIGKFILTGDEDWSTDTVVGPRRFYAFFPILNGVTVREGYCTHFKYLNTNAYYNCYQTSSGTRMYFFTNHVSSVEDFKQWLSAQYANGTPVTVWYVLAEPTTGIVNEPLRKIGDYADTVSGLSIPTVKGSQTFDVETSLKPSEVRIEYHKP